MFAIETSVNKLLIDPTNENSTLKWQARKHNFVAIASLVVGIAIASFSFGTVFLYAQSAVPIAFFASTLLLKKLVNTISFPRSKESAKCWETLTLNNEIIKQMTLVQQDQPRCDTKLLPVLARAKVYEKIAQGHLTEIKKIFYRASNLGDGTANSRNYKALKERLDEENLSPSERQSIENSLNKYHFTWYKLETAFLQYRFQSIFCQFIAKHPNKQNLNSLGSFHLDRNITSLSLQRMFNPSHLAINQANIFVSSTGQKFAITRTDFKNFNKDALLVIVYNCLKKYKCGLQLQENRNIPDLAISEPIQDLIKAKIDTLKKAEKSDDEIINYLLNSDEMILEPLLQPLITDYTNEKILEFLERSNSEQSN